MKEENNTTKEKKPEGQPQKTNPDRKEGSSKPNFKGGRKRFERFKKDARPKPEFDQKIVSIRRVARVIAGGRRFSFSVSMVAGNRKGSVGIGVGKASDTALAIEKAFRNAQKNKIDVLITKEFSIPHEVSAKVCGSSVLIMPAPGKGVLAGSSVRDVMELAGVKNINAKILSRSKNKLNNAKAAIKALSSIKTQNKITNPYAGKKEEVNQQ